MSYDIRLRFCSGNDPSSEAIRLFSRSHWSHVEAVSISGLMVGALLDGVEPRLSDYATYATTKIVSIAASTDQANAFWDFIVAQIGKPYDRLAIIAFALDRNWRNQDSWFCSELIAAALEDSGVIHRLDPGVDQITPRDLYLVCSAISDI